MVLPVATDDSRVQAWIRYSEKRKKKSPTSSSLSFLHSSQPPSHFFFILLTATSRFPTHSGLAPAPHCIGDKGVLGGSVPCQSHNQTVPNDPSPSTLRGLYERVESMPQDEGSKPTHLQYMQQLADKGQTKETDCFGSFQPATGCSV